MKSDLKQKFINDISEYAHEQFWLPLGIHMANRCKDKPINRAIDIGFEHGSSSVWLDVVCSPKKTVAIDISLDGLSSFKSKMRKYCNGKPISIIKCSAEKLPFKENVFDLVFIRSVLQYTNTSEVLDNLFYITGKNGKISIIANLVGNPVINVYRKFFKKKDPRSNMQIKSYIKAEDIKTLFMGKLQDVQFYYLLSPALFPAMEKCRGNAFLQGLFRFSCCIERWLIKIFPLLKKFAWYAYIEVRK